ncbi:MAG: hypothetical protein JWQ42_3529 [Edaphobacter sp.]|nr:hypothetical protein [Edaphobacter sp.]
MELKHLGVGLLDRHTDLVSLADIGVRVELLLRYARCSPGSNDEKMGGVS